MATMMLMMTAMSMRMIMMMKSFMMLMIDSSGCVCDNDDKRVGFSTMDTVFKQFDWTKQGIEADAEGALHMQILPQPLSHVLVPVHQ